MQRKESHQGQRFPHTPLTTHYPREVHPDLRQPDLPSVMRPACPMQDSFMKRIVNIDQYSWPITQ